MQNRSDAEFTIGFGPLKLTVKGRDPIEAMKWTLNALVIAVALTMVTGAAWLATSVGFYQ